MATSTNTSTNTGTNTSTKTNIIKMDALKGVKFGAGIALGLLASLTIGATVMYYVVSKYVMKPANAAAPATVEAPAAPIFLAMEPFTVNLRPGGQGRFLHVGVTLKVRDAKSQAQINLYMPEVRNRVLMLLSDRSSETLVSPSDKAKLAEEVLVALNKPFVPNQPPQQISGVVFTAFVLQ